MKIEWRRILEKPLSALKSKQFIRKRRFIVSNIDTIIDRMSPFMNFCSAKAMADRGATHKSANQKVTMQTLARVWDRRSRTRSKLLAATEPTVYTAPRWIAANSDATFLWVCVFVCVCVSHGKTITQTVHCFSTYSQFKSRPLFVCSPDVISKYKREPQTPYGQRMNGIETRSVADNQPTKYVSMRYFLHSKWEYGNAA